MAQSLAYTRAMSRLYTHGQHFLRSPRLVLELIGHSNIRKNDLVYDLGAGSGVITAALAQRCRQVVAVELEPAALAKLRQNAANYANVEVVADDILTVPLPSQPYKVFANIPFNLSSPMINRLTTIDYSPKSIYLIVQRQFARKLTPSDRHFTSLIGAQIAPWWQARIRRPLRRTDFTPPPGVDTVLLELKPQPQPLLSIDERGRYRQFVKQCYSRQDYFANLDRSAAGIDPERKPSELSPLQWVVLYQQSAMR